MGAKKNDHLAENRQLSGLSVMAATLTAWLTNGASKPGGNLAAPGVDIYRKIATIFCKFSATGCRLEQAEADLSGVGMV